MVDASDKSLPRGMLALGWSGVLPFAGALIAAFAWPAWSGFAAAVFVSYGAVILSFLGGARWGRGLAGGVAPTRFVEAVMPSLIAFAALLLLHTPPAALALLAAGFAIWLAIDLRDPLWPAAYRRMRLGISVVVLALHAGWLLV
ncbi:DUF3429 domain-containing protein [Dyella ginsengisoli]|uniref:DUF3429 domain-containing protein n=1 Tax=Dyella ginsengisoli TaxID=363848 RepID=UPI00034B365D|nr:DUF3429 domain-containing protein [Dyella ginsengisoli]